MKHLYIIAITLMACIAMATTVEAQTLELRNNNTIVLVKPAVAKEEKLLTKNELMAMHRYLQARIKIKEDAINKATSELSELRQQDEKYIKICESLGIEH